MKRMTLGALAFAMTAALACGQEGGGKDYGKRPDWTITDDAGKEVKASDFDGKVVLVDFWATWCPPCRKEIPGFIKLQEEYKDKGFVIIGFSFDRDKKTHDDWLKANKVNYTSFFAQNEAGMKVVNAFQKKIGEIEGIPTTVVIDPAGKIVYKHVGYGSKESFEKVIKPLLKDVKKTSSE